MAKSFTQCEDIKKRIQAAIEDEAKAGPEYQQLAADTQEMFCGGQCPNGFLAKIGLQTLSVDEHKHHDFLVQLLASVEKDCEETREPELPPTIASFPLPGLFPEAMAESRKRDQQQERDAHRLLRYANKIYDYTSEKNDWGHGTRVIMDYKKDRVSIYKDAGEVADWSGTIDEFERRNANLFKEVLKSVDISADVELKLVRSREPGEWIVRYYEHGRLDDDKSYYTNDKEDAIQTMDMMRRNKSTYGSVVTIR
jgi:hypothetical protein